MYEEYITHTSIRRRRAKKIARTFTPFELREIAHECDRARDFCGRVGPEADVGLLLSQWRALKKYVVSKKFFYQLQLKYIAGGLND